MDEYLDYVNEWYDMLNDAYNHRLSFEIISSYIDAIQDTDSET